MYSQVKVKVPDILKTYGSYGKDSTKKGNISMIRGINKNYGSMIDMWANVFEMPSGVLISLIATESGGVHVGKNKYDATGLTQVTPDTAVECVTKWKKTVGSELPKEAINKIKSSVPTLLTAPNPNYPKSLFDALVNKMSTDASFSIMIGALVLRWLLERFSGSGYGHLNKAIVAYNVQPYIAVLSSNRTTPMDSTALQSNTRIPSQARDYLLKMLGIDGFLYLIYKENIL